MKTGCTIIVFNFNSIGFLRLCIKQIRKNENKAVPTHIIIADQSTDQAEKNQVVYEFGNSTDITIVPMAALRSGYAVDYVFRNVEIDTEFTCTLDCDAFPIHPNWLYLPITLMKERNFAFVGGLFFESRPEETAYYHKNNFYCMSQCYRVGRTADYKEMAMYGGFTVFHARKDIDFVYGNDDWAKWAAEDYANRGSDDGVVAHCWEDNHREHDKLSLATTHIMGEKGVDSGYGGIIDDMVFHFGFSHWSNTIEDKVGKMYGYWKKRIQGGDENVLEEMIEVAMKNPSDPFHIQGTHVRGVWDGKTKTSFPSSQELDKYIEYLKTVWFEFEKK